MPSFHNMHDMLQANVDHLAVEINFWKKNTPNNETKMGHNALFPDFGWRLAQNCWHKVNCYGTPSKIMMIMIKIIIYKSSCTQREQSAWVVISVIVGKMIPPAPIPSNSPGTAKMSMGYLYTSAMDSNDTAPL